MRPFDAAHAAQFLGQHLTKGTAGVPAMAGPSVRADAYQVQDALIAAHGTAAAWKVGKSNNSAEPYCAPILQSRIFDSGANLQLTSSGLQLEAELGLVLNRDIPAGSPFVSVEDCAGLVDSVVPAIEVLGSRIAFHGKADPLWKLADLQANKAVVLGVRQPWTGQSLRQVSFSLVTPAGTYRRQADHPFGDPLELFCWLINHAAEQRAGLVKGSTIITGSYCGVEKIENPGRFAVEFDGFEPVWAWLVN